MCCCPCKIKQFSLEAEGPQDIINNLDVKENYTSCFAILGPFAFG